MHITVLLEATITISEVFLECVMLVITFMMSGTNQFLDVSFVSWFEMFVKISFYFLVRGASVSTTAETVSQQHS